MQLAMQDNVMLLLCWNVCVSYASKIFLQSSICVPYECNIGQVFSTTSILVACLRIRNQVFCVYTVYV